ncbi:MAG: hypothetical protein EU529_16565 [Promethearchaeota archaeon]|nr:MAG: hypothetical protein EU540_08390 [Candidatus Lokiarchaeota archaeon]TFG19251.1 MAG: hypothetical protein EU529_16565 [Candidatus Lokiarchaeota archaeon]
MLNDLVKISIIGHPATGKTTILKLLSDSIEKRDRLYIPTQGFDLRTVKFDQFMLRVWDFGGQKSYLNYLDEYLVGSDLVLIVTDSSPRNVLNSRRFIEFTSNIVDTDCPIIAIANKQDLCKNHGRMEAKRVEDILKVKTYGLTAIESSERKKLIDIIKKELNQVFIRRGLKDVMNVLKDELNNMEEKRSVKEIEI